MLMCRKHGACRAASTHFALAAYEARFMRTANCSMGAALVMRVIISPEHRSIASSCQSMMFRGAMHMDALYVPYTGN
uniref:Uncharacterized protein n=1 Tax=Ulva partita TaxID=1605170 RepID=A0A1C9ZRU4_9CHLO|nr:hypothetical protein [Ulva partita]